MTQKEQHNKILIDILDEIVRVCHEHNLVYYLAAGTLLGAVRHHGMIPWDDDIDIIMPRSDYDRLREIGGSVFNEGFRLVSNKYTKGYYFDAMKVESTKTTLIERVNPIYVGGVFVDVFPLDNVPSLDVNKDILVERKPYEQDYIKYLIDPIPQTTLWKHIKYLRNRRIVLSNNILEKIDQCSSIYKNKQTEFVNNYFSDYAEWEVMPVEYYGKGTKLMFEGKQYNVPSNYDAVLRTIYGNYMQLPPVEKRVNKHNYVYEELSHRLTQEELNPILQSIRKEYRYHFSIKREVRTIKSAIKQALCYKIKE